MEKRFCCCILGILIVGTLNGQPNKTFGVTQDIETAQFADVVVSPNQQMVAVHTWRGSLLDGKLHDELRFYSTKELSAFVNAPGDARSVEPDWVVDENLVSTGENGPPVTDIRWFDDGRGVAFLVRTDPYHRRLCFALVGSREIREITPPADDVLGFSVRDADHYVFTIASRALQEAERKTLDEPFQVGTGKLFMDIMFPEAMSNYVERGDLWAAVGGAPAPVKDLNTGLPIVLYEDGNRNLVLAPDGLTAVTVWPLAEVPEEWALSYPPPFPGDPYGIRAGRQDLDATNGWAYVGEYVSIRLADGMLSSLTHAPDAQRAGWWEATAATPQFSDDGRYVLLPGTFLPRQAGAINIPCVAIVDLASMHPECIRALKRNLEEGTEVGYEQIAQMTFAHSRHDQVSLKIRALDGDAEVTRLYDRLRSGAWILQKDETTASSFDHLAVEVRASFKEPPVLIASDRQTHQSRIVFDPNPQWKDIAAGVPELYKWRDSHGRAWEGILYRPLGFRPGTKYPLVIQNHGFAQDRFVPSGGFPSAFIAEELASAGIMVLHVRDCSSSTTAVEGPCNVEGYDAAIATLAKDGSIDSSKVGIIGFSRTVFYVLETLTTCKCHFAAASITDGITAGYMDYLLGVGPNHMGANEGTAIMGAPPFGTGLERWLRGSPDFNMDKITTPLRVVATRSGSLLEMWEPYALLEDMQKPVDLIVLNSDEHIITNPRIRFAAQTGNLDWFRFWLQGYTDPDPAKASQYRRWEHLREIQLRQEEVGK